MSDLTYEDAMVSAARSADEAALADDTYQDWSEGVARAVSLAAISLALTALARELREAESSDTARTLAVVADAARVCLDLPPMPQDEVIAWLKARASAPSHS